MKRKIVTGCLIFFCFLLQTTIFQTLALASIAPNLMIILTASFGFMRGKKSGMFVGFFCGLFMDVFSGNLIGFYALLYMVIGYLNGFFRRLFYAEDIKLPLILISGSEFVYGMLIYLLLFLLRSRFDFPYYLGNVILPELIYTILVTLILYQRMDHGNYKISSVRNSDCLLCSVCNFDPKSFLSADCKRTVLSG